MEEAGKENRDCEGGRVPKERDWPVALGSNGNVREKTELQFRCHTLEFMRALSM